MDCTWITHGSCMNHTWIIHYSYGSTLITCGSHMDCTWVTHGSCMNCTWIIHGSHMDHKWFAHGSYMDHTWIVNGMNQPLKQPSCPSGVDNIMWTVYLQNLIKTSRISCLFLNVLYDTPDCLLEFPFMNPQIIKI